MASNIQKTIDLIFNGTDNVSSVLGDIEGGIESTANSAKSLAAPFEVIATSVLALDAALLGLIATGLKVSSDIEAQAVKMKNALGLPTEEAERFEKIAKDVYSAGYGEDLAASFEAVTLAQLKFGDSAEVDIGRAVTAAAKLEKTFGVDYNESLGAAKNLMTNFGLSADEAFDFVATGYQKGLDGSGDFIESINEYSTQFSNGGASADQFFSVMESGFQEGMLGTDRAADAFKEFRVRIQDGSATTADALSQIGLGDEFTESLASGEITAIQAFGTIINKLNATENSSVQLQAGVGLMGTQFEDMGTKAALAISTTTTDIEELKGTLADFDSGTFTLKLTSAWRTAITAVGDMPVWDTLKDKLGSIAGDISINFADVMGEINTADIEASAEEIFDIFAKFFEDAELDLTTAEGMKNAMELITESIETLLDMTKGMAEVAVPAFEAIVKVIQTFNDLSPGTKEFAGNVVAMGTALGVLAGAVSVGGTLIGGISTLAKVLGPSGALVTGVNSAKVALTGLLAHPAFGLAAAGSLGFAIGTELRDLFPSIDEFTQKMIKSADSVLNFSGQAGNVDLGFEDDLEGAAAAAEKVALKLYEIPDRDIAITTDMSQADWDGIVKEVMDIPDAVIGVTPDLEAAKVATEQISVTVFDAMGKEHRVSIEIPVEATGIEKVKADIADIPTEKILAITLQGEIDTKIELIKASAKTAEAAFKYTAEVDIAEAQEMTKQLETAFNSINIAIQSSADVYSSAFAGAESSSAQARWEALDILRQEQELREQSFALQKELTEAQIKYTEAKAEAIGEDGATIQIDSTGLEPALEMIMWQIIEKVQIRASETAADMLLT